MAIESFPPLLLVASRFLLSGALMLGLVRWRGLYFPRGKELLWTAFNGFLILGIGNACLTFSELLIPSSLAALFTATSPFWLVGLDAGFPEGDRFRWPVFLGVLCGFAGAAVLVAPNLIEHGLQGNIWQGFLILQLGSCSWSLGSILQRHHSTKAHPFVSGGVQQFSAGLAFLIPAVIDYANPIHWSSRGVAAFFYLVLFGSIVGYSSYIYILDKLPVALISTYTYVNPVVAAALGWLFYREHFGARETTAMVIIFAGVAIVKRFSHRGVR